LSRNTLKPVFFNGETPYLSHPPSQGFPSSVFPMTKSSGTFPPLRYKLKRLHSPAAPCKLTEAFTSRREPSSRAFGDENRVFEGPTSAGGAATRASEVPPRASQFGTGGMRCPQRVLIEMPRGARVDRNESVLGSTRSTCIGRGDPAGVRLFMPRGVPALRDLLSARDQSPFSRLTRNAPSMPRACARRGGPRRSRRSPRRIR
jgi:hypothetical protein